MHELPEPSERRLAAFVGAALRRAARTVLCIALVFSIASTMLPPKKAAAQIGCDNLCPCEAVIGITTIIFEVMMSQMTRNWVTIQFELHRNVFMIEYFFYEFLMKAMMLMDAHLTSAAMTQVTAIGGFFDASQQMKTQRLMQQLAAKAHRDYHPTLEMCAIGTAVRNLGGASRDIAANAAVLTAHQRARQLHSGGTIGTEGAASDKKGRIQAVIDMYCDINDNNNEDAVPNDGLEPLCGGAQPGVGGVTNDDMAIAIRADIPTEMTSVIEAARPERFSGLMSNLFASDLIPPIPEALIMPSADNPFKNEGNRQTLLDIRAIAAKRSVAEYSFSSVLGSTMRSASESDSPFYMATIIALLGAQTPSGVQGNAAVRAPEYITNAPSYYSIMNVLTKKIYQDHNFYMNLYGPPEDVARKGAAMRAIGLMQNMDLLKSQLRSEMSLSVAVELEIDRMQEKIDNRLKGLTTDEAPRRQP